ncbi:unnamed protein product [Linum trigynum]|uniref:Uncharacterized protein n=1 Tax=Linum trigynum TaxID=586398 RepID=A0AAV2CQV5_9ROSI
MNSITQYQLLIQKYMVMMELERGTKDCSMSFSLTMWSCSHLSTLHSWGSFPEIRQHYKERSGFIHQLER